MKKEYVELSENIVESLNGCKTSALIAEIFHRTPIKQHKIEFNSADVEKLVETGVLIGVAYASNTYPNREKLFLLPKDTTVRHVFIDGKKYKLVAEG